MTLSTKSTTTSELPLRCCTTTLTMAFYHSHSWMLYLLPLLLFLLLPHPCITAASWIIASLDYHCLFGPPPLFGLPRYFWVTAVSTYQTKQSVTLISAFFPLRWCPFAKQNRKKQKNIKKKILKILMVRGLQRWPPLVTITLSGVEIKKSLWWRHSYSQKLSLATPPGLARYSVWAVGGF